MDPIPRLVVRQLLPALATLLLGVAAASMAGRIPDPSRLFSFAAAMLLIGGMAWSMTSIVRLWAARG